MCSKSFRQPSISISDHHSGEGKTVNFSPHQVVIKDLKDPKHVPATGIVDYITMLYKFDNFGSSSSISFYCSQ
jgi:hypothetical protein